MFRELQSLFEIHPPQNRGMHSQHAIPLNDEATTFKALCLSLGREDGRCFPGKKWYQEIGEDAWLASKFKVLLVLLLRPPLQQMAKKEPKKTHGNV